MKILPSIFVTALIIGALWTMVWAQPEQVNTAKATAQSDITLPLSLVGISSRSDNINIEIIANRLFSQLSESPDYLNQLKDAKSYELFLIYSFDDQSQSDQNWKISAAVSRKALKQNKFQVVDVPKGPYKILSPQGSNSSQLSAAWQKLDENRTLNAVIESYLLDENGNVLNSHSIVSYR